MIRTVRGEQVFTTKSDAKVKAVNRGWELHTACQTNNIVKVAQLLQFGNIKINCVDHPDTQVTPFHMACKMGHTQIARMLIQDKRVDVMKRDIYGISPLESACKIDAHKIVRALVQSKRIKKLHSQHRILYHVISKFAYKTLVELANYKCMSLDKMHYSANMNPLQYLTCEWRSHNIRKRVISKMIAFLLSRVKTFDINWTHPYDGATLLYIALLNLKHGGDEVLQELYRYPGLDINKGRADVSPFYLATQIGDLSVIKHLTKHPNINLNAPKKDGSTPFFLACECGSLELIQLMLSCNQIQIDIPRKDGVTPIYMACLSKRYDIVSAIVASGRPFNTTAQFQIVDEESGVMDVNGTMTALIMDDPQLHAMLYPFIAENWREMLNQRQLHRQKNNMHKQEAANTLVMALMINEEYLRNANNSKFFNIVCQLPIELQMQICNYTYGCTNQFVSTERARLATTRVLESFVDYDSWPNGRL